MPTEFLESFSHSYTEARAKFRKACNDAQISVDTIENPNMSPDGERLSTDVAWFGPKNAERVVVAQSGTHGVEGLCGSACQVGWIKSGSAGALPPNTAVMLIHLINPYGAAWRQQETEEGVNLNRNYLDFSQPLPKAPLYAEIHDALMCPDIEGSAYEAAQKTIAAFRERHGQLGYQKAIFGGQYEHPKGMNFGGTSTTWSNRTLRSILDRYGASARSITFLDYHTGLGPYGHATLIIFCPPKAPLFDRVVSCFGPTVIAVQGDESAAVAGVTACAVTDQLPHAVVTPVTIEYGTYDVERECNAVVKDLWLRNFGERESPFGREIKQELVEYFYPDSINWKEMVWYRSQQIMRNAIHSVLPT